MTFGIYLHLTTFISFASALAKVEFIAMPNEEYVRTLMGSVAIDHKAYDRILPNITCDTQLFPE